MAPGPKAVVNPPPASVPRVGLLASARDATNDPVPGDGRWENGFAFQPYNCSGAGVADPCDTDERSIDAPATTVEYQPFEVWAGDKCSPFQWRTHDYQGRARALLVASQSKQIEAEFWTGTLAQSKGWSNQYLTNPANPNLSTISSGALKPENALACLEQALSDCSQGQRGFIHCTKTLATHWDALHLLRREGNAILTIEDTIVIPGAGYDGSAPGGFAARDQSVWAYATSGTLEYRLGEIELVPDPGENMQATIRDTNLIEWRAWRPAAVTFDNCCVIACEVEIAICPPGGS